MDAAKAVGQSSQGDGDGLEPAWILGFRRKRTNLHEKYDHPYVGDSVKAVAVLERDIQQHGDELRTSRDTINRMELAFQHLERGDGARAVDVLAPLDAGVGEHTFRWDRDWLRARA